MDFSAARAALPSMTRALFGSPCTITPRVAGRMKTGGDPSRTVMTGVMGRFDFSPDDGALGGGRNSAERLQLGGETATVSFDRAALAWLPVQGDHVSRVVGSTTETYEIVRSGRDGGAVVIFWVSRVD